MGQISRVLSLLKTANFRFPRGFAGETCEILADVSVRVNPSFVA